MRLYAQCPHCGARNYLTFLVLSRRQLQARVEVTCPICGQVNVAGPNEVRAEPNQGSGAGGAIIGGLLGAIAGPVGILLGGALGGVFGASADENDRRLAERFNQERV